MKNSIRVHAALISVSVLFGFSYVIGKYLVSYVSPSSWAFIRAVGTAIVFLLICGKSLWTRPTFADWRSFAVAGLFGVTINQLAFFEGLKRTTPIHSAVLNTMVPLFTLLFAIAFGNEKINKKRLLGMLLAFGGVLIVLQVDQLHLDNRYFWGDILTLVNALSFSFYLAYYRSTNRRIPPHISTGGMFFIGSLLLLPYGMSDTLNTNWLELPSTIYLLMIYIVIGGTVGTYYLNNWALSKADSSFVALYIYIQPIVATFLSHLFFGERLTIRLFAASLLVFIGVGIGNKSHRRQPICPTQ